MTSYDESAIREKIVLCLALSHSPNENEALAALTKARALMAKYKIEVSEYESAAESLAVEEVEVAGINYSKRRDWWIFDLSTLIANHYCCSCLVIKTYGKQTYRPCLIGRHIDLATCKVALIYAIDTVRSICKSNNYDRSETMSYGLGFVQGLNKAYQEQDGAHPEFGMILVKPQAVLDYAKDLTDGTVHDDVHVNLDRTIFDHGFSDGNNHLVPKIGEATE